MPREGVEFRSAAPDDAAAMFALHKESVRSLCRGAYTEAELDAWFFDRSPQIYERALSAGSIYVACLRGIVVGFVGFAPGEVTLLFVSPSEVGRGLGRALFELGLAKAEAEHEGPLVVVATKNSQRFYERYGFAEVEREEILRGDPPVRLAVVRMERPPSQSPNLSIERTCSSGLRPLEHAAHVKR